LDADEDGYVMYNDFCELCEERRRHIDPFVDSVVKQARLKQSQGASEKNQTNSIEPSKEVFVSKELQDYKRRHQSLKLKLKS